MHWIQDLFDALSEMFAELAMSELGPVVVIHAPSSSVAEQG